MHVARVIRCVAFVTIAVVASARPTVPARNRNGNVRGTGHGLRIQSAVIAGAQVTVAGTTRGALTNDAGEYTIRNVPAG